MTWSTPTEDTQPIHTMTGSRFDDRPTRKRPLGEVAMDDGAEEKVIVLTGPNPGARQTLFQRLMNAEFANCKRAHAADCGEFMVAGERVQLVVTKDSAATPAVLGERYLALCVTTDTDPLGNEMWKFWEALRKSHDPACVVLVSANRHLDPRDEAPWKSAIEKRGLDLRVFRVNCADSRSPELFARLLTSPVQDQGEQPGGIEVEFVDQVG